MQAAIHVKGESDFGTRIVRSDPRFSALPISQQVPVVLEAGSTIFLDVIQDDDKVKAKPFTITHSSKAKDGTIVYHVEPLEPKNEQFIDRTEISESTGGKVAPSSVRREDQIG